MSVRFRCACALLMLLFLLPAPALGEEEPRFPGPAEITDAERERILESGSAERSPWLDCAFTLLEEGNPFAERYNLLTGAEVRPRLPFGVPYLYGGNAASHVFAKEPDYVVQAAWIDSPLYYKKGFNYLYGFDCTGFVKWVWTRVTGSDWPGSDGFRHDRDRHVYDAREPLPDWPAVAESLRPGDILVMRHPENHMAMYVGTLRGFGYTAEEVPDLAAWLDYPLVIHSNTNAALARRFAWLIANGLSKYRSCRTTDGGVCVSILGVPPEEAPGHVVSQNQHTRYFPLPDGTWLTLLSWEHIHDFCWWRK